MVELGDLRRARRDPGLVVLEGFHAVKHAVRFGAELLGLWTADADELVALSARLAPDVVLVQARTIDPGLVRQLHELARYAPVLLLADDESPTAVERAIRAGATYANAHTALFPAGEIRGQIRRGGDD